MKTGGDLGCLPRPAGARTRTREAPHHPDVI